MILLLPEVCGDIGNFELLALFLIEDDYKDHDNNIRHNLKCFYKTNTQERKRHVCLLCSSVFSKDVPIVIR